VKRNVSRCVYLLDPELLEPEPMPELDPEPLRDPEPVDPDPLLPELYGDDPEDDPPVAPLLADPLIETPSFCAVC
jgi:hypothetical protein